MEENVMMIDDNNSKLLLLLCSNQAIQGTIYAMVII